jgi:cyanophycin synthetase
MNVPQWRCLHGPNIWSARPVIEGVLDLGGTADFSATEVCQVVDRIRAAVERAAAGMCADRPFQADTDGLQRPSHEESALASLAPAFAQTVLQLQVLAGNAVTFFATRPSDDSGAFVVAAEFAEEPVGLATTEIALHLLAAAMEDKPYCLADDLRRLWELADKQLLPASTEVVYEAARARGIPAARLSPEYGRYLRLGQGSKQHRCRASEPDSISAVARMASTDKHLAKQILAAAGVPVPEGRLVSTADEAWAAACTLGVPVAVKPQDADLAIGVSLDLRTREQVEAAFYTAHEHSDEVIVERFAPGLEHRVLVVAERVVAVSRIEPPHVVGDGVSTIAELAAKVNQDPRRGDDDSDAPLRRLKLDDVGLGVLAAQGYAPAAVLRAGQRVLLRRNPPYLMHGGSLSDLTDHIHPSVAAHAVAAAEALQLRVAGLDVVVPNIGRPLEEQGGVVVEINVSPGLWLHIAPWADSPRPVGEAIVASMFPPGEDGRIPVVAVVEDDSRAATKHLAALLAAAGCRAGIVGDGAIVVGPRRWTPPAGTPQERAGLVLQNPTVDAAILETSSQELLDAGFGNDRCDVAVVLDREAGDYLQALRHALSPQGVFVLPAGQKARIDLPVAQLILIAAEADHPRIQSHLAADGRAVVAQGDDLLLARGAALPVRLGKRPKNLAGQELSGLLAALAAALALSYTWEMLESYLESLP